LGGWYDIGKKVKSKKSPLQAGDLSKEWTS